MKWLASLAFLALTACSTTHYVDENSLSKSGSVLGLVYDLDRRPVPGVQVTIDRQSPPVATDVRGHFSIGPVPFGTHTLKFRKEGYEPAQMTFTYGEASQNTYIQLASRDQLYEAAMKALESDNFDDAWDFVDRAESFSGKTATSVFLRAGVEARQRKPQAAVKRIEDYLANNTDQAALELMLADLYEKQLNDKTKALESLKKAQAVRDDAAVRQRISNLSDEVAASAKP